jgi:hypothetical protein
LISLKNYKKNGLRNWVIENDQEGNIYFDGIGTMEEKALCDRDHVFSVIMLWDITQDTRVDSLSLLNPIDDILSQ